MVEHQVTTSTPQQSKSNVLRSFNNKRHVNKRKADPDMRLEAVLGCACKRMRGELLNDGIVVDISGDKSLSTQDPNHNHNSSSSTVQGDFLEELKPFTPYSSLEDLPQLSYDQQSSSKDYGKQGGNVKFPLNDAEQVAAFFELVASDGFGVNQRAGDASSVVSISQTESQSTTEKPISDQEVVDILLSCEVDRFTTQFDSLYNRVLSNLSSASVEVQPRFEQFSQLCDCLEGTTCFNCKRKEFNADIHGKELLATGTA